VPREGSGLWVDVMLVSDQAPNPPGAQLSDFVHYVSPNAPAKPLLVKAALDNPAIYPPAAVMDPLKYLQDVGPAAPVYDEVWTPVKGE